MEFPRLFERGYIGCMEVKNRIIMAPFEKSFATPDGEVTERYVDYMVERSKGGAGLIIVETMYVDPRGKGRILQLGIHDDALIPGLKRMAERVHQHGAKIGSHIAFAGRQTSAWVTGFQPIAPSPIPCGTLTDGDLPRELTRSEIKELVAKFADAARRTKQAGWDMVSIHGAHGYLVAQFFSPLTNKRTDEYGGSLEKRMRFPLDVVKAVREAVGDDFPVSYRMSADEFVAGGVTLEQAVPLAKKLEESRVDLIDVSAGTYESIIHTVQPYDFKRGYLVHLAEAVKKQVSIPVSVAGRINDPALAEQILQEEKADFVSIARAFNVDPYWPQKAAEGRLDDILRCPACMVCSDHLGTQLPEMCAWNPASGRERELAIRPTPNPKTVLVVGGGPAGMEAAWVAAIRGHHVTLREKEQELGGMVRYVSKSPGKGEYSELIRFLSYQLHKAGVKVELGYDVTAESVAGARPDVVVVATGARFVFPRIPGAERGRVYTALQVLDGSASPGAKVVVFGGGRVGCEMAVLLAERGTQVVIVEPSDRVAQGLGLREGWVLRGKVQQDPHIRTMLRSTVEEIKEHSVVVQTQGQVEELSDIDTVVVARGMASNNELADSLISGNVVPEVHVIGSCRLPRTIEHAMYEGLVVAREI